MMYLFRRLLVRTLLSKGLQTESEHKHLKESLLQKLKGLQTENVHKYLKESLLLKLKHFMNRVTLGKLPQQLEAQWSSMEFQWRS